MYSILRFYKNSLFLISFLSIYKIFEVINLPYKNIFSTELRKVMKFRLFTLITFTNVFQFKPLKMCTKYTVMLFNKILLLIESS